MAIKTEFGGPDGRRGSTLASTTLKPFTPRTLQSLIMNYYFFFIFRTQIRWSFKPEFWIDHSVWVILMPHCSCSCRVVHSQSGRTYKTFHVTLIITALFASTFRKRWPVQFSSQCSKRLRI